MTPAEAHELRRVVTAALRAKMAGQAHTVAVLLAPYDAADVALCALDLATALLVQHAAALDEDPAELLELLVLAQAEMSAPLTLEEEAVRARQQRLAVQRRRIVEGTGR